MNHTPNELPNALDMALGAISEDSSKTVHLTPQEAAALNRYVTELLGTIGKRNAQIDRLIEMTDRYFTQLVDNDL